MNTNFAPSTYINAINSSGLEKFFKVKSTHTMVKSQNVSRTQEKAPKKCNMQIFYVLFNLSASVYFGAVRQCIREIFYLKKFLLACDINGFLIILGCET
jgi:hypothetical protein